MLKVSNESLFIDSFVYFNLTVLLFSIRMESRRTQKYGSLVIYQTKIRKFDRPKGGEFLR